jgi:hypothetical protein
VLADAEEANRLLEEAETHAEAALSANLNSDNHVLTAVALALAIFFAGVSTKLDGRTSRLIAISLSTVIFLGAATVLVLLPKVGLLG